MGYIEVYEEAESDDTEVEASTKGKLRGVAYTYGDSAEKYGFVTDIEPGAFTRSIDQKAKSAKRDIRLLQQHDDTRPLGRVSKGTLTLKDTKKELRFEAEVNLKKGRVADLYEDIRDGEIDEMSPSFRAIRATWDDSDPESVKRTVHEAELIEISVVTAGAFDGVLVEASEDIVKSYAEHRGVDAPERFDDVRSAMAEIYSRSLRSDGAPDTMEFSKPPDVSTASPQDSSPPQAPAEDMSSEMARVDDAFRRMSHGDASGVAQDQVR